MMLWCSSPALRLAVTVALCLSVRSFTEPQLLCSSSLLSLWWEYEVFTLVKLAWRLSVVYKNETWLALSQPMGPCEGFRLCYQIKGETIRMMFPMNLRPYYIPDGEYQAILIINIIDNLDRGL